MPPVIVEADPIRLLEKLRATNQGAPNVCVYSSSACAVQQSRHAGGSDVLRWGISDRRAEGFHTGADNNTLPRSFIGIWCTNWPIPGGVERLTERI